MSACVVLSVLGGLMVLSMAVPRVTYALAREEAGNGPLAVFARLHPRFGSPAKCRAAADRDGAGGAGLALSIAFWHSSFFCRCVSGAHRGYAVPVVEPVRRWWYPVAPLVFLAGSAVLAAMLLMHSLWPSLMGAAWCWLLAGALAAGARKAGDRCSCPGDSNLLNTLLNGGFSAWPTSHFPLTCPAFAAQWPFGRRRRGL